MYGIVLHYMSQRVPVNVLTGKNCKKGLVYISDTVFRPGARNPVLLYEN